VSERRYAKAKAPYTKRNRATLRDHLQGQWKRGYSGPNARPRKPPGHTEGSVGDRLADLTRDVRPAGLEPNLPPTLGDIWPKEAARRIEDR
jgi:hypothetical protein